TGRECRTLSGHQGLKGPWGVDFSPDGRLMASGSHDGVRLWDLATAREIARLPVESYTVVFDPASGSLISSGADGLYRWPIEHAADRGDAGLRIGPPRAFRLRAGRVPGRACLSADGRTLAVAVGSDQGVVVDVETQSERAVLDGQPSIDAIRI